MFSFSLSFRLCDNEEGDDDLIVMAPSDSRGSRRPISIDSESRTPSDSSVVDLTNDSGMEDEGVIDLTSFQVRVLVCVCVCVCVRAVFTHQFCDYFVEVGILVSV